MKLNISYPANGSQKLIEIEDERKLRDFMEKRVRCPVPPFFPIADSSGYFDEPRDELPTLHASLKSLLPADFA